MQRPFAMRLAFALLLLVASLAVVGPTIRPIEGQVIEARATASETLYLWDATPYVIHLSHDGLLGPAGLQALKQSALLAFRKRAETARSKRIILRVLYQKIGAIDPAYGHPTFAGVERVFTMRASRLDALRRTNEWERDLARQIVPPGLQIEITGRLPAR